MSADKTIGIIGAGAIVFNSHLPLLKAMGAKVVWIIDANKARAEATAKAYNVTLALTAEELHKAPPTDVVLLACPYGTRKPYYEYLRGGNGAIYIEKPVARSEEELEAICGLRPSYSIAAGFHRRSMGITNIVKGLIEDGVFGQVRRIYSEFGTATVMSSGGSFAKDVKLAGGGQLLESAIHNLDAVCYMAGINRATVRCCKMIHEDGFDLHTEADIGLTNGQGHEIELELLVTCFKTTRCEIRMEFDNVTVTFSLFRNMLPEIRTSKSQRAYEMVNAMLEDYPRQTYDTLFVYWTDFLNGWQAGKVNYTNACSSRVTTSIIEQMYQLGAASDKGKRVRQT